MPDAPATTSTQAASTLPSHVAVLTIIAQVVGYLIATFGGLLTVYQTTHSQASWVGAAITIMGLLFSAASHYGYVKGQVLTQNALVNAVLAIGGPAAYAFLATLVAKGTVADGVKSATNVILGTPTVSLPPGLTPAEAQKVLAAAAPPVPALHTTGQVAPAPGPK